MDRRQFLATTGAGAAALSVSASASAQARSPGGGLAAQVLDITEFGVVAGDSDALAASNSAAVEKLLAHLLANRPTRGGAGTPAIKVAVPAGQFRFARPWIVKCALWLEGQSNSHRNGYATVFDFDRGGFEFHGHLTDHDGPVSGPSATASGWRLENIACVGRAAAGTGHHGLYAVTRGDVVRCSFFTFPGDGIRIESMTGFGASTNNANGTRILFCQCGGNGGNGINLLNADANCILTQGCDLHSNGGFGIFDNAFLSNHHIGHHAEGNGLGLISPGHKMGPVGACCTVPWPAWRSGAAYAVSNTGGQFRTNAGKLYWLLSPGGGNTADAPAHTDPNGVTGADGYRWAYAGTDLYCRYHTMVGTNGRASTTPPGTDLDVWMPFEFAPGPIPGIPLWKPGMTWGIGGSYCGNSRVAETVWEACYSEGGQPPAQIRNPQIWVGGQTAPSGWSTCVEIRGQDGAIRNPHGLYVEKSAYNGQRRTAQFGTGLAGGRFLNVAHPTRHPNGFSANQDADTYFSLDSVATFATFTGANTAFTGGRAAPQPGVVHMPQIFLGSGSAARCVDFGTAPPSSGHHAVGEIRYNSEPAPGGKLGWVCTAAGTPGTWKAFGAIDP